MKTLAWICLIAALAHHPLMAQDVETLRKERDKLQQRGMWRDLVNQYEEKLMPVSDGKSGDDLQKCVASLGKLDAWKERDDIVERSVAGHPANPSVLQNAAVIYLSGPFFGRIVGGEFERQQGYYSPGFRGRGGKQAGGEAGQPVQTEYRDRIRALQLLLQAAEKEENSSKKIEIWDGISGSFVTRESWKLQTLTPLDVLPEWGELGPEGGTEGAPWNGDSPVLYQTPASWQAAKNDGERMRFAWDEQIRLGRASGNAGVEARIILAKASFSQSQFGTGTLNSYGGWLERDPDTSKGMLETETLADDECLAKTSDGVRRFRLPADQHFIALYRSILDDKDRGDDAGDALVQVFLGRRQYEKAREVLEQTISKHGPGDHDQRKELLKQITGNWGRFEIAETVPAGTRSRIPLIFRNTTDVKFTAAPVDMEGLLRDTIQYLTSNPRELDWQRVNISSTASQLLEGRSTKYIGKPEATWDVKLEPAEGYRETRQEIEMPLDKAGAWWVTGKAAGGNSFRTLVWIVDSVLVQNDVAGAKQWWLADAAGGAPREGAEIEFFGYRMEHLERKNPLARNINILTKVFTKTTDADGKSLLKPGDLDQNYQWMAIARKPGQAPAFHGFNVYQHNDPQFSNGNQEISYGISDRPLYKPGDTAHLKFYLRNVGYADPNEQAYANLVGELILTNGRGEEAVKISNLRTDELGSIETEVVIPKDGGLGTWNASFQIPNRISAAVSLQVEEYRKPEYEVKVEAPDVPVKLGEKFSAIVKANYFHGSPVRNAEVEIIVKRSSMSERWFPISRWDWLYGSGAWWNGSDAEWHPTWNRWGCIPPHPPWWQGNRWTPDELVVSRKLPIGEDGTVKIEIDTAPAKQIHGDIDAKYSIEARVVDASRREERGSGSVIAARKPFEVVVWTDRGYARSGDKIQTFISAATLAGKPVVGAKGTLKVFHLTSGEDGKINETEGQTFDVVTDAEGRVTQTFAAPETGQYRLSASLAYQEGEAAEGGAIFNVHGTGRDDPAKWKFGPLELIADQTEYTAGDTLKLRVNSDRENANVWLFLHIAGTSGREARRIQLDGKSLEVEIPLDLQDMPNMFIQGISVHGAKVHTAVRQVLLPPVSKLVDVTLMPAKSRVKPGEKSALRIQLRDAEGKPVKGHAVVAIYDKSLEAITGGSNVGLIHENFWSWKNSFYPSWSDSLISSPGNLSRDIKDTMYPLGSDSYGRFDTVGRGMGGGRLPRSRMAGMSLQESSADAFAAPAAAPLMAKNAAPSEVGGGSNVIAVRKEFADLLKWSGNVQTDAEGNAEIPLEFPDNLTTWKARVWTLGKGTQVGEGTAEIITSKELLVRLQAPRFLVERDESVFSAIVQNDHDAPKTVKVSLEMDGKNIEAIDGESKTVEIAARSEARIDWRVRAVSEGESTIRMKADAGDDGDAVERKIPVLVHGMLRQDAWSRAIEPGSDSAKILMEVPEKRRPDQSKLTVRFSPTIAGAVVDAIPYLAAYPHGCTEQTLNRFVPAVVAQQMLRDLKIDLAEVKAKRTNLNPQELGNAVDRAAQWKQWQTNPVFDELEMGKMVAAGVGKLMSMQNGDGGWGWFSGYRESSYPHTTAVVVHGLLVARQNGAEIPDEMMNRGIEWMMAYERKQVAALQLHVEHEALRKEGKKVKDGKRHEKAGTDAVDAFVRMILGEAKRDSEPMLAFLYRDRVQLPVYAKCLLGIEQHRKGDEIRRDEVIKMISQYIKRDPENQTVYLDLQNISYWWNWYGSEVEAHSWFLKLLAYAKPQDADARGLAKYLVNNRKHATYWDSTRDTAYAIEAISTYFKESGEDTPEMEVDVLMDGKSLRKISVSRENMFTFDGTVVISGEDVTTGGHEIELRRTGKGTLYANAYLEVFSLEDKLRAAGLEVKVERKITKLVALEKENQVPDSTGLVTTQSVERFRREPLEDGGKLASGDRIEVELILESKNDYEYLIFSDAKAAGFEALDALSGYVGGGGFGESVYMEPRDRTVDFYIRTLPRGKNTVRYQLRAEAPGIYKALPATGEAMYAPELRANSDDIKLEIAE